ncbi:Capsular polysaccharide biosynthesis protein [Anaerocolumna jejuensis DSM 15929]|uniref:Capsular polysaccharide biosynthesis protein n=2 Tax=Anaerocolumna TaxID=1843210 RepID=A0A1M7BZV3_9FIRM|nr:Capsular polysaccharide biosynthesis protein [Anaerocolumna jejuensis DSM 15929]
MGINMRKINTGIKENFIELSWHLKKRFLRILLIGMITGITVSGINHFLLPDYYFAAAKFQAGMQVSNDYMILIKSWPFLEKVIYEAGVSMTPDELQDEMFITVLEETRVMEVQISDYNPERAETLIGAFVKTAEEDYGDIFRLKVVEEAGKAVPLPKRDMESFLRGFLLGAITSVLVISVRYIRGSRIRKAEEIETLLNLSTLAVLPDWDNKKTKRRRIGYED